MCMRRISVLRDFRDPPERPESVQKPDSLKPDLSLSFFKNKVC